MLLSQYIINVDLIITAKIIATKNTRTSKPKKTRVIILMSLFFNLPQSQNRMTQKKPKEKKGSTGPVSK
jgi:hypothetical protein